LIPVTKPFLPPKADYLHLLDDIWARCWLTNNGPLVNELELRLKEYLKVDHLLFTGNGTIALQMAIKVLAKQGEVITTPFSYVATTSAISWEGSIPVFADIDPDRLTIDPREVESRITDKTVAILATHVYGIPCHIEELAQIAERHRIALIYDAAHAFGAEYKGRSLLAYGDFSILSTHATKLFHTVEGGVIVARRPEALKELAFLRNFGHDGPDRFAACGVNGKNSEFHAAMGLVNLPHVQSILDKRRTDSERYDHWLLPVGLKRPRIPAGTTYNYAYHAVIFESEDSCLKVFKALSDHEIFPRRYFYPSLSHLDYVRAHATPVSDDIARRVLCLPHYYELSTEEIDMISRLIVRTLRY
jgi:dTDP-4-amino-4,6-dideoxygalactose transaminase